MERKITITEILDDLRAADEIVRRYERHFWLSSEDFFALYQQGRLDDGDHTDSFSEWAGYYKIKLKREAALKQLSRARVQQLVQSAKSLTITIDPSEPSLSPAPAA
jgi:hypothetical protein